MDRQHAERLAVGVAAFAHAGAIGCDLGIAEQRLALDVAGDIIVAGFQLERVGKPGHRGDVRPFDAVAVRPGAGQHIAVEVTQPQIEIHGIGAQDHGKALRDVGNICGVRVRGAIHHGGIGGPPAHVAGALIEVSIDQFDGVECEIDHAFAARSLGHFLDRVHQVGGSSGQLGFQLSGDVLHLLADAADFLRHHGKARAERAGARAFDQRVQRQHFHLVGDLLDRPGLLAGDLIDLGGQSRDQDGNICLFVAAFGLRRRIRSVADATNRSDHRPRPLLAGPLCPDNRRRVRR